MSRPKGSKNKNSTSESIDKNTVLSTKKGYDNEFLDFLNGDNSGFDAPLDDLINGKKLVWKKKYIVYLTNTSKHGKVASEEEAMQESYIDDKFFSGAYKEGSFIVKNKKTQEIIFNELANFGIGFKKLCEFVNNL